uniref:Putative secreted peptide n=1 Tax=Anopheles braziliensis TaxID=58242 RepID=A0A2M3ZR29_9DIPT
MTVLIEGSVRLALAHLILANWLGLFHTKVLQFVHQSVKLQIVAVRLDDEKLRIRSDGHLHIEQLAHGRERHLGQLAAHYRRVGTTTTTTTTATVVAVLDSTAVRFEIETIEAFGQLFRFFAGQRCVAGFTVAAAGSG